MIDPKTRIQAAQSSPDGKNCSWELPSISIRKNEDGFYEMMFQTGQVVLFEDIRNVIRNLPHLLDRSTSPAASVAKIPKDQFEWMRSWLQAYDRSNGTQIANDVMDWVLIQPMQQ